MWRDIIVTGSRVPRTTCRGETQRRRRSQYSSRYDPEKGKSVHIFVVQAKETTSAADIKLRIDGPEAASADNAVEVGKISFSFFSALDIYRMKTKSEAHSVVNLTFYSLVFLSLSVWAMSGGFLIFAIKTGEV